MTVQSGELCAPKIPTLFTTVSAAQRSLRAVYAFFPTVCGQSLISIGVADTGDEYTAAGMAWEIRR